MSICFFRFLPAKSISVGILFSLSKEVIECATFCISSLTYRTETLECSTSERIFCSCIVKIILSTPPATPVAPRSSRSKALVRVSYLPPPAKAPSLEFLSNTSKTIPE